jgi:hypothetical protein
VRFAANLRPMSRHLVDGVLARWAVEMVRPTRCFSRISGWP